VYELRVKLRDTPIPAFLVYFYFWQGLVLNPIIQAYGFVRKRYILILLGVFLQMELYSLTSLRVFLMADFFQFGLAIFYIIFRRHRGTWFVLGMTCCLILMTGWNIADRHAYPPLVFMDRGVYSSGQLSAYYFDFFRSHPFTHFQDIGVPFLRHLFPGTNDLPAGELIGREYFPPLANGSYTNAAAHLWADAFSMWGYPAMVVMTMFAGTLMWIVDSSTRYMSENLALLSSCMVGLSLSAQGAQTAVMTGGVGALVVLALTLKGPFESDLSSGLRQRSGSRIFAKEACLGDKTQVEARAMSNR
jgi:hypothetical protein